MKIKRLFLSIKSVTLMEAVFAIGFAIVGVVLGELWPHKASEIINKGYVAAVFGFICGTLGFMCSLFIRGIYESIPSIHEKIKEDYEKIETCIEKKISLINIKIEHPTVFSLVSEFAEDSIYHLIGKGEDILILEYVRFLESSLEKCSLEFFATSLLTPTTWLNNQWYIEYFDKQAKKKQSNKDIKISRVFLCQKQEFDTDVKREELIRMHGENRINIGYYDPENFKKYSKPEFCKDFVMFKNNEGKWILDAGQISEIATTSDWCKIRFVYRVGDLNSEFSDIFKRLENTTWLWHEQFENKIKSTGV